MISFVSGWYIIYLAVSLWYMVEIVIAAMPYNGWCLRLILFILLFMLKPATLLFLSLIHLSYIPFQVIPPVYHLICTIFLMQIAYINSTTMAIFLLYLVEITITTVLYNDWCLRLILLILLLMLKPVTLLFLSLIHLSYIPFQVIPPVYNLICAVILV